MELYRAEANLRSASDPNRLLRGEKPDGVVLEDALHWLGVYGQLLQFNGELIEAISKQLESGGAGQDGGEAADLLLVQAHVQRLEVRRCFWDERRRELLTGSD